MTLICAVGIDSNTSEVFSSLPRGLLSCVLVIFELMGALFIQSRVLEISFKSRMCWSVSIWSIVRWIDQAHHRRAITTLQT